MTATPDTAEQAYPFDPTAADKAAVDDKRAEERGIRADQAARISKELRRQGYEYPARVAEYTSTDPGW
ncbi:hypothetical protein [Nocardiopsis sp. NRRL B-16309]|uniref:hypothetical protein n=1 Tax=Nocardiopsis sp. NRRL B-16309 TaxID=1519494 RepID=UPI0006AE07BD|nr:hypothetical protein [Nocardiopsis sp. NRRL B-16309]KOX10178.1 hypothetical protein ADL05_26255 [Nocardiopsis sp. NRRL B-16309]